ncbi:hypothetical protein MCI96_06005 [Enterocloster sp. OA11]|nr:hypothetical protein [Enterocloster sp. OA11]MCH1934443.1 hypothetical protein [Enterocloster sp. OA11]
MRKWKTEGWFWPMRLLSGIIQEKEWFGGRGTCAGIRRKTTMSGSMQGR